MGGEAGCVPHERSDAGGIRCAQSRDVTTFFSTARLALAVPPFLLACSGVPTREHTFEGADASASASATRAPEDSGTRPPASDSSVDPTALTDAATDDRGSDPDATGEGSAPPPDAGPVCTKQLTVLFAVGTGAGSLASHQNGCWTVVDADGAANNQYRKCSTSDWMVKNPSAPNYAFDDMNPNDSLGMDQSFLQSCSAGATGDGWEYLAYRGSWRLVFPANHLKAFFAELYTSDAHVDDLWFTQGVYQGNGQLGAHTVYPMINIGPVPTPPGLSATIENDGLAICKTINNNGYFGVYVGAWNQPMPANDPRVVALASALDSCTM
jgi:hypothetical protein